MKNLAFYVCPKCSNLITTIGDAQISCCGKELEVLVAAKASQPHVVTIEPVENELYITSPHEMRKDHHISFVAYVTGDKALLIRQYPEWDLSVRFQKFGHGKIYFYCSNHGLFYQLI